MIKKYSPQTILILFLLVLFPSLAFAQVSSDTVIVDLQLFIPEAGIFFLNDLNLTNLSNSPLIFAVTIENYFMVQKELVLHFGISRGNEKLIDGITQPFFISPFPARIYLTSQNLLGEGGQYSLQNIDIGSATEELRDAILAQGKLPTGLYQFFVEVDYENNNVSQRTVIDIEEITINNPTTLDLISPGMPAEMGDPIEIYTTLPLFQWHSNASEFRITVCEKLPMNSSPADVMNNEPRLQQMVPPNQSYFLYPPSGPGAWPLEEGKTYYWQMVAIAQSSSGPVELPGEIWAFKVGNISGGMFSIEHQQLVTFLTAFFGDGKLGDLFENGGALDGFTFTGVMLNNDRPMSQEDLLAFIERILNNQVTIRNCVVE